LDFTAPAVVRKGAKSMTPSTFVPLAPAPAVA
jgi:hypothetical protein